MRMINSHYLHAWSWHNLYSADERAAAAARGVHPCFRGSAQATPWSGTGPPPKLLFNDLWMQLVGQVEELFSQNILLDLDLAQEKLTRVSSSLLNPPLPRLLPVKT